jgi:hypothetical protein
MGETRNVTRRALLGGVAAAGAASLVRPAAGLADAFGGRSAVSARWVGSLSGESAPILAPSRFALLGLEWSGPDAASIELRAQAPDGRWSPWVGASVLGHDPDGQAPRSALFGEPIWTGAADRVQLRSNRLVHGLRVHFVGAVSSLGAHSAAGFPAALPVLDAGPGQPPIIARRAWGQGQARPAHGPEYGAVELAFVHHTVNPNGYSADAVPAMLLAIFDYHVQVRGFWDIAYNFMIDSYGRIWEARAGGIDMPVIGAHAGGYNAQSTGVAVLGDFMNVVPSQAAIGALEQLLAWKLSLHGVPAQGHVTVVVDPASAYYTPFAPGAHVSLPRVAGHRDGDSTDCPGNAFYGQLPSIRPRIASLAGTLARLTMSPPPAVATAGVPLTVSGRLRTVGSNFQASGIAGAPVEVQLLQTTGAGTSAVTIATAITRSDGSWSAQVTLQRDATLRALCRQHPASVSGFLQLTVVPAITLAVGSTAPLRVGGTISPSKRRLVIDVYAPGHIAGKPLASERIAASRGSFTASIPFRRPGEYVLVARSQADATNGAGASPPVPVSIP